jgi:hypothetical protein
VSLILLRVLLFLGGVFAVFSGMKSVFGGFQDAGGLVLTHEQLVQNNHIRFLGGLWTGVGVLFLLAPFNLKYFQPMLYLAFALIFAGGIARLTVMRSDVLLDPVVLASLVAELALMPALAYWLARTAPDRPQPTR